MDTKVEKLDFLDYYFYPTNFQTHIGLKVKQAKMKGAQYVLSAQQAGHMTRTLVHITSFHLKQVYQNYSVFSQKYLSFFFSAKNLYGSCTYNQQCSKQNKNSFCKKEEQQSTRCRCRKGYREERAHDIPIRYECVIGKYIVHNFKNNIFIWSF